jgi:DNA-binding NtrC family response regulator
MNEAKRPSILVVDDEEIIREFLTEVLNDDHDVFLATDGDEAIDKLAERSFDLVITDLKMPKVSGDEVVKCVHEKHPGTPVIIISGYSTLYAASQSVNHGAAAFLAKPFSIVDLTRTVEEALGTND